MLHRLLQGAARDGIRIHTARTASRFRVLGWWLLIGSPVVEIAEANARGVLLAELAEPVDFTAGTWLGMWSPLYPACEDGGCRPRVRPGPYPAWLAVSMP